MLSFCFSTTSELIAQQKSVSVSVHARSVQLQPSAPTFVTGVGNVTTYFSTYNGSAGDFLIDMSGGYVSGEVRPRSGSGTLYEGGYAQATPLQAIDYGSYTVTFPTADTDGNGIPDVIQHGRNGTFSATGSGYSALAGVTFSISINFNRAASAGTGTYTATTTNSLGQSNSVNGAYALSSFNGTASYTHGTQNTLTFALADIVNGEDLLGSTTFAITNPQQLNYEAFTIVRSDGALFQANAGSLSRVSGTKIYRGSVTLVDGALQTWWPDFQRYVMEITDQHDSDSDGIPDLTDLTPPSITSQPQAAVAVEGQSITLTVVATGAGPLQYQWFKDDVAITGATGAQFTISSVNPTRAGLYRVQVTNPAGTISSSTAHLAVTSGAVGTNRLHALSVRSYSGKGADTLIMGVVVAGNGPKKVVARGVGPSLAAHSVQGFLADPQLRLYNSGGQMLEMNEDWGGSSELKEAFADVGMFELAPSSKDAALVMKIGVGAWTSHLTSTTGTGIGLMELYDYGASQDSSRFSALAVRGPVGAGENVLIVGFVISGTGTKEIIVRGGGPALSGVGVSGALGDPQLKLFNAQGQLIAENGDWGGSPALAQAFTAVGLGSWPSGSKDAAMIATLPVGLYTVQLSGVNETTGVGLIELYER